MAKKNKLTNAQKKKAARGKFTEDDIQKSCLQWFELTYPKLKKLIWHTPNGGFRSARAGARFKALGVRPGVPDLFIAIPNNGFGGLFVELKHPDNYNVTDKQKAMQKLLKQSGYKVIGRCTSLEQFQKSVRQYFDGG